MVTPDTEYQSQELQTLRQIFNSNSFSKQFYGAINHKKTKVKKLPIHQNSHIAMKGADKNPQNSITNIH